MRRKRDAGNPGANVFDSFIANLTKSHVYRLIINHTRKGPHRNCINQPYLGTSRFDAQSQPLRLQIRRNVGKFAVVE